MSRSNPRTLPSWATMGKVVYNEVAAPPQSPAQRERTLWLQKSANERAVITSRRPKTAEQLASAEKLAAMQAQLRKQSDDKLDRTHPKLRISIFTEDDKPLQVDGKYVYGEVRADQIQNALLRWGEWNTQNGIQ
jgi:hypothetical protein